MVARVVEAVMVLCAVIGFYALCPALGRFPGSTWPLLPAVVAGYACYLHGRDRRRLLGGEVT
ncbi:hypothetical protein [Roseicella frigidaeris]|uniref:Uncharacterized protein n=1 Tax=Roseicella frigidaeris TaxID=2230885 RepID=A0A327M9S7_9PROT|nr:hypothetical protein [Roseicella frigidaeris]RAI59175.1 hypothetical protein DOO78_09030 [Roseicella frigidaeris]